MPFTLLFNGLLFPETTVNLKIRDTLDIVGDFFAIIAIITFYSIFTSVMAKTRSYTVIDTYVCSSTYIKTSNRVFTNVDNLPH